MAGESHSKLPNGDIYPCRFVKLDATADGKCLQAGSAETTFGISGKGTRRIALDDYDTGLLAKAGDPAILIYGLGNTGVPLEIGSGGCTAGDYLGSDTNGKGIVVSADKAKYGAKALTTVAAGKFALVEIVQGELSR